jgi:hypothetical protein
MFALTMRIVFGFLILVLIIPSFAQNKYTLSGYVREDGSREFLIGVTIISKGKNIGTTTNSFGFYSIDLPEGEHELTFLYIGYLSHMEKITMDSNKTLTVNLKTKEKEFGEVVIRGRRTEKVSENVQMSKIEVPVATIKDIPALMGEKDVLKVLQLLPGVQSGSEGQSGLYVRGGGPDQNLIILDGATVYNAQHLFGFFSLFNGDALRSVELYKGGFPARYGGRLSSVIDLNMKDGNKEKYTGEVGVGIISARGVLEGPIANGKGSFILSGRRTYIDALTQPIILAFNNGNPAGYFFHDFNAKANYEIDDKNRIYLSGYFGQDKFYVGYSETWNDIEEKVRTNFGWGNATGTLRWNHVFNQKLFSNTSIIYSNYNLGIKLDISEDKKEQYKLRYNSGIRDWAIKQDFDWFASNNHRVRYGTQITHHLFTPQAMVLKDNFFDLDQQNRTNFNAVESGTYIEDDWKVTDRFRTSIGLRLASFHVNNENYINLEPRVGLSYRVRQDFSIKAAYTRMNQFIHLLSNSGIGLPTDLWVPATDRVRPQMSDQVALGFAYDIPNLGLTFEIEGYYKTMNQIIAYREGASFLAIEDIEDGNLTFSSFEDQVTSGNGYSQGIEFFIQKKEGPITGWIGYTLSKTEHQFDELNNGKPFFARYDRRHDVSVVAIYKIKENINFSLTWVYGTGNAITLPIGFVPFINEPTNPNFAWLNSGNEFTDRNTFRMRAYHRADIGVQISHDRTRGVRTWEFSAYNLYSRMNPFFYFIGNEEDFNFTSKPVLKQISLFPLIPSISWSFKFN